MREFRIETDATSERREFRMRLFSWGAVLFLVASTVLLFFLHSLRLKSDRIVGWLAAFTIKLSNPGTDTMTFTVVLQEVDAQSGQIQNSDLSLRVVCGPGDEGEPVVTIGFPEDF